MKPHKRLPLSLLLFLAMALTALAAETTPAPEARAARLADRLPDVADKELARAEKASFQIVFDEKKLCRDVFARLGAVHDNEVFMQFAQSEAILMQLVSDLSNRYGVEISFVPEPGVYSQERFNQFYGALVKEGEQSLGAAWFVATRLSELAVADLTFWSSKVEKEDLSAALDLAEGQARNRLWALVRQLEGNDIAYEPAYVQPAQLEALMAHDERPYTVPDWVRQTREPAPAADAESDS